MFAVSTDAAINGLFLVVFAVSMLAALWARWKRRVPLGLGVRSGAFRDVGTGLAIGSVGMAGTVAVIVAVGGARISHIGLDVPRLCLGLAVFALAAVGEEVVYRALMLTGLSCLLRRPVFALLVSSVMFGLVHLAGSPDATMISVTSNAMGGLMYGVAFLRSGRIWLPVGIHFAWNFVQASLCGFPTSDNTDYSGAVAHVVIQGAQWLSGGAYGPEGSVISLAFRAMIIGVVLLLPLRPVASSATQAGRGAGRAGILRPGREVDR